MEGLHRHPMTLRHNSGNGFTRRIFLVISGCRQCAGEVFRITVPADQLPDEEIIESLRLDAQEKSSKHLATYLLEQRFTADEVRGHHRHMKWMVLEKPTDWGTVVAKFREYVPDRGERDLRGILEAMGRDAPGIGFLKLLPKS